MGKINFLLDSIDRGSIVLPEFQRGYVWSRNQVKGLIQSLYQRFPVGTLLIWHTSKDATELRNSSVSGSEYVMLLLDGQQRITSLYGVIRGKPPPFFEDPERARAFTGLYFHVEREEFEFYMKTKMDDDPCWISVTSLMNHGPKETMSHLFQIEDIDQDTLHEFMDRVHSLHDIRDIELHEENISDKSIDVVVDIFSRVNSGGTKLSKGDLALSRICAIRPEARKELRDPLKRWHKSGFDFTLDWFLKCVNVVATGKANFEAMKDLSSEDFGVALKKSEQAIDFLLNLVSTRLGLDHNRVLLGPNGFPAMVKHVVESGGAITDTSTQNRLLFWYIHQGLWGRYDHSTKSTLSEDLATLEKGGINGLIDELKRLRDPLVVRSNDFDNWSTGSRFYPLLYMLTRVNDSKDFVTGLSLSQHLLGKGSSLEVHHIFPKALLYEADYTKAQVNAVANFAFLTKLSNQALGKQAPEDYFTDVSRNHDGALTSQWIPEDSSLRSTTRYLDFLERRRGLLADAANTLLNDLWEGKVTKADVIDIGSIGVLDERGEELQSLSDWCAQLGLARPDISAEIADDEIGESSVYPDAIWPEGMQSGLSQKVALLLEGDEQTESKLGELGYRFFTSRQALNHYVEELLNIDLDGDGIIGPISE